MCLASNWGYVNIEVIDIHKTLSRMTYKENVNSSVGSAVNLFKVGVIWGKKLYKEEH